MVADAVAVAANGGSPRQLVLLSVWKVEEHRPVDIQWSERTTKEREVRQRWGGLKRKRMEGNEVKEKSRAESR